MEVLASHRVAGPCRMRLPAIPSGLLAKGRKAEGRSAEIGDKAVQSGLQLTGSPG